MLYVGFLYTGLERVMTLQKKADKQGSLKIKQQEETV